MKKRTLVMVASIFGIVLGLGIAAWTAFGPDEVRLTRAQIQTLIDEQLPYEQNNVAVSNATVGFEGNELVVAVDFNGERLGQQFAASGMTIGEPIYRSGSFYFVPSDIAFSNVIIGESNDTSLTERILGAAERYLPNNEGARNLITDLAPSVEAWLREHTMRAIETVLSQVPVYTLPNDTKGIVAKAVLGEVFVENDELVITFTLWRLTWWVAMAGFIALASIGMLGAMIKNPGLFMALSVLSPDF